MNAFSKFLSATVVILLSVSARAQVPRLLDPPVFGVDQYGVGSVIAADFNGDGLPDVAATAQFGGTTMDVLLNSGDGTFRTLSAFDAGISPSAPAAGDLNGDGVLDLVVPDYGNTFGTNNQLRIFLGNGDGTFGPRLLYHLEGNHPDAAAVGDFNRDGKLDVVVAIAQSAAKDGIVQVLLGNGDGTLQAPVTYSTASGAGLVSVADLNGDGFLDLVVGTSSGMSVLLGRGDGTFQSRQDYTFASGANGLVLVDINHDGKADVAATTSVDLSVLLNKGDGTFGAAISTPIEQGGGNIVAGDLDQDGMVDVVVSHGVASVYFGNGDGTFRTPVSYLPGSGVATIAQFDAKPGLDLIVNGASYTTTGVAFLSNLGDGTFLAPRAYLDPYELNIATKDLNGDGKPDLIGVTGQPSTVNGAVSIFLNDGTGEFLNRVDYEVGEYPRAVVGADVDGDGKQDLAVGNQIDHTVSILIGNGDGTFQTAKSYPASTTAPQTIAAGDFNGDGAQDLVTANQGQSTISVLLSVKGAFPTHTDLTVATGPSNVVAEDFNGDGKADIAVAYTNSSQEINSGLISVFISKGDGTFKPRVDYPLDPEFDLVLVGAGDVNGDGKLDLVAARSVAATALLLGNGDGTFQSPIDSPSAHIYPFSFPSGIQLADLNGDGTLDVVLVWGVSVLYGNPDGTFQPPAYFASFSGFGTLNSVVAADFNGDGAVDVASGEGAIAVLSNTGGSQVTLTSSKKSPYVGDKITFSSRVTPTFPVGTPTGTVSFLDGTQVLGTAPLVGGKAKLSTSALSAGKHLIQAQYNGDQTFVPNQSKRKTQVVNP